MVCHLRRFLYLPFDHLAPRQSLLVKLTYWATSGEIAHECVMVFFVLSGYLVGGSVLRMLANDRWSWREYLLRRGARLYTVLIPALILGCALDGLSTHHAQYQQTLEKVDWSINSFGLIAAVGNLAFTQRILVATFGSNAALWSLSNEFWYYIAFPFLALTLWPNRSLRSRLLSLIVLIAIGVFVGQTISLYGLIWLAGAAISFLPSIQAVNKVWHRVSIAAALAAVFSYSLVEKKLPGGLSDCILALCVMALIYLLLLSQNGEIAASYKAAARHLSISSYTMYLFHLPFLTLIVIILRHQRSVLSPRTAFLGLLVFAAVFIYVQIMYLCFEKHTTQVLVFLRSKTNPNETKHTAMATH